MFLYPSEEHLINCVKANNSYNESGYNLFMMRTFVSDKKATYMAVCFNELFLTFIPLNRFSGAIEGKVTSTSMSEVKEITYKKGFFKHHFTLCIDNKKNDFSCPRSTMSIKWVEEGIAGLIFLYGGK